jgi:hypothetical protein
MGTDNSVAAKAAAGMPAAEEGTKAVAEGSEGDSYGYARCTPRGNVSAMLRPGTRRPQSRCDIQAMVPGFQGVCLGNARQSDASQRTKSVLPTDPCVAVVKAANKPSLFTSSLLSMVITSL